MMKNGEYCVSIELNGEQVPLKRNGGFLCSGPQGHEAGNTHFALTKFLNTP